MYQSFNIDKAAEHLKNIIHCNRCSICDKLKGKRVRYPCGHTSCEYCVSVTPTASCPLCLTPQDSRTIAAPSIDSPLSRRSLNANILLNVFQLSFNVDVNKRHRISEQLKVEKELFPQCIQAPAKYYNKRKSSKPYTEDKENLILPGEEVSCNKMENSNANVQTWLNRCPKRKPLGDLNQSILNTVNNKPTKHKPTLLHTQNIIRHDRKRDLHKTWINENDDYEIPAKKHKKEKKLFNKMENNKLQSYPTPQKVNNHDSATVNDEMIVIDDSQSVRVDKDMNAWLAVLDAEKKNPACDSTTLCSETSQSKLSHIIQPNVKVPFLKKSPLYKNCIDCINYYEAKNNAKEFDHSNVSITIENKSFTAIINVSKLQNSMTNDKNSVGVQTEFNNLKWFGEIKDSLLGENSPISGSSKSGDMYQEDNLRNKSLNVIIAESDSDEDLEHSIRLEVTADVHRSCDEMVLGDVENLEDHQKRPRRAARGYTPTSTDSSDKENYNPNRVKRSAHSKKKSSKPVKK